MMLLSIFNLNNFRTTGQKKQPITQFHGLKLLITLKTLALEFMISVPVVLANCNDRVASLTLVQPIMERLWPQLKAENPIYAELKDDAITLTEAFATLTGRQKQQALEPLKLGYNNNWFEFLTPEEKQSALEDRGLGTISPYRVYARDGRLISVPYDGCTRLTLLTEKERFSYYYQTLIYRNRSQVGQSDITPQMLRNAGQPSWRRVNVSIESQQEEQIRRQFWQTIGYDLVNEGWWIAWVPEQGHFEINVPVDYDKNQLENYLQIASPNYNYVVIDNEGSLRNFDSE
ncbi:phosphoribosylaminoimidazolesuccinocarboxamide synthase [Cyanothece sp. BG0011]|uniref:phosphoribosylaminoimidazolesuccinocarboxamide synthase n=1 Tax=Cyanothece sp. BG0011 TaxID=2082950 RepID=UPI000D1F90F4|nr:phosphoribosylaminoimidazolesuccinocarboxamide synthase [Cyanothece sp. BG0011]